MHSVAQLANILLETSYRERIMRRERSKIVQKRTNTNKMRSSTGIGKVYTLKMIRSVLTIVNNNQRR